MYNLEGTIAQLGKIVTPDFCNECAKKTRLVQRSTSRLDGFEFAQALMIPRGLLEAETLNSLATRMHNINPSCTLSASALSQRINSKGAQEFMKACFGHVLMAVMKQEFSSLGDLPHLIGYNRILIEDSTQGELNERLQKDYPGRGGTASKAAIKINYVFDYLTESFVDISFHSGNTPDQRLASQILSILEPNDLVIRDLGYYGLGTFKKIEETGSFYISRFKADVLVYQNAEDKIAIDLPNFLERNMVNGSVDRMVYISESRHPVRLIAHLMAEQAVAKKRRVVNRAAKRRGRTLGKKVSRLMNFCVFITNVPSHVMSADYISACYRSRWRIELVFKEWKSCLKLHVVKGVTPASFHCLLYGRLIMIALLAWLSPPLIAFAQSLGKELSTYKLCKYLIHENGLATAIQEAKLEKFMNKLLKALPQRLCMDKRSRKSLRENVRTGQSWCKKMEISNLGSGNA